ncbi:MAG: hypothetical protein JWP81_649 [Ferruginibacter sp.]|nr:hypothetical protein [Ferruginibacter sp.]
MEDFHNSSKINRAGLEELKEFIEIIDSSPMHCQCYGL